MSSVQQTLWSTDQITDSVDEDPRYLREQIITYIGNKRTLLPTLGKAMHAIQRDIGKEHLRVADIFAGTGVVSRFFKRYSEHLIANDLEKYSSVALSCYLTNREEVDWDVLRSAQEHVQHHMDNLTVKDGFIRRLYAPHADDDIRQSDRCFYTVENAQRLDSARRALEDVPQSCFNLLLGPLLSAASVHTNTSGVFKGFYKNPATKTGQFGGAGRNALKRILGKIELKLPVLSNYSVPTTVYREDSNTLAKSLSNLDVVYLDPPYNQHPYGSNYFMLNLLVDYQEPKEMSRVSGIPIGWNRSAYNKPNTARVQFEELVSDLESKYIMISYNDEGFIAKEEFVEILNRYGRFDIIETPYNTFRGSRNLRDRTIHVTEYLFLLRKY